MDFSIYLAYVLGFYLLVMATAILLHQEKMKKIFHEISASGPLLVITGIFGSVLGFFLVFSHNIWMTGWPVVVTLLSWFILIQATLRLLSPSHFAKVMKFVENKIGLTMVAWFWLFVGVYLIYAASMLG